MNKHAEYYVLYCTKDKTYLGLNNIWINNVIQAVKYQDLSLAQYNQSKYDESIKIMQITIKVEGKIVV